MGCRHASMRGEARRIFPRSFRVGLCEEQRDNGILKAARAGGEMVG